MVETFLYEKLDHRLFRAFSSRPQGMESIHTLIKNSIRITHFNKVSNVLGMSNVCFMKIQFVGFIIQNPKFRIIQNSI